MAGSADGRLWREQWPGCLLRFLGRAASVSLLAATYLRVLRVEALASEEQASKAARVLPSALPPATPAAAPGVAPGAAVGAAAWAASGAAPAAHGESGAEGAGGWGGDAVAARATRREDKAFFALGRVHCFDMRAKIKPVVLPPLLPELRDAEVLQEDDVCAAAWRNCELFFNSSESPLKQRTTYNFMHLAKSGGSTINKVLGIRLTHMCMATRYPKANGGRQGWSVVIRHPIERLVSDYYFKISGRSQKGFKLQQRKMCQIGTGMAYGKECVPKITFFQYATSPTSLRPRSEDNYQFNCLLPQKASSHNFTMREMRKHLVDQFAIIGITDQLMVMELMLSHVFGLNKTKVTQSARNSVPHPSVEKLVSKAEYKVLLMRNRLDLELYYWALDQVELLKKCYGEVRLREDVAAAKQRPYFKEDIAVHDPRPVGIEEGKPVTSAPAASARGPSATRRRGASQ